jgi:hypothetical protein
LNVDDMMPVGPERRDAPVADPDLARWAKIDPARGAHNAMRSLGRICGTQPLFATYGLDLRPQPFVFRTQPGDNYRIKTKK